MASIDVIVLGAGAAGLMAALTAGRLGRRVVVLDHARRAGEKILISGGGRCNFTNRDCAPERFFSANPAFCRAALSRYTPEDFVALVDSYGIAWHEKTLGQLFCDGSARQIVDMLLAECQAAQVDIRLGQRVNDVTHDGLFTVHTDAGPLNASSLILATGGLSIPKLGATGLAYRLAEKFGLPLVPTRPALVPFTLPHADLAWTQPLAGVSTRVVAHGPGIRFNEGMVFTHRGLSGPAILQVSSAWREGAAIDIDLLPDTPPGALHASKRARPKAALRTALSALLPQRLADVFATPGTLADMPDRDLAALEHRLRHWRIEPAGTEGYAKAEVTLGGIDTRVLSQRTMEARTMPGLFAIGEAVDVTGWLGGYNFQWAWASGTAAGAAA